MPTTKRLSRGAAQGRDAARESSEVEADDDPGGDFIRSLAKGLAVIEAFGAASPAMTLSDVARKVGLPRGTARRLLLTLVQLGYAGFDGKLFSLRPRALNLGFAYLYSQNLWQLAQPAMVELVEQVHESCSIAVLDGTEIVYVARVPTAARIMSINLGLGTRLPAIATSMGRVLLSGLPEAEVEQHIRAVSPIPQYTPKTLRDRAQLLREIEQVRKQGWAMIDQELEIGLRSIAAAITDGSGRVIAAINIGTHASRWPIQKLMQEVLPRIKETAAIISKLATG